MRRDGPTDRRTTGPASGSPGPRPRGCSPARAAPHSGRRASLRAPLTSGHTTTLRLQKICLIADQEHRPAGAILSGAELLRRFREPIPHVNTSTSRCSRNGRWHRSPTPLRVRTKPEPQNPQKTFWLLGLESGVSALRPCTRTLLWEKEWQ